MEAKILCDELKCGICKAEGRDKPPFPHTQHVGDILRCAIECPDVQTMLRMWKRVRKQFNLRPGWGKINNRTLGSITIDLNVRGLALICGGCILAAWG